MYTFTLGYFIFLNWKMQNHSQMKISRSYLVHVKGIIDLINVLVGFLIQTLQTQECLKFMQCLQAGWIFHHKFFVPHVGLFNKNCCLTISRRFIISHRDTVYGFVSGLLFRSLIYFELILVYSGMLFFYRTQNSKYYIK